jgi:hypothetical protein
MAVLFERNFLCRLRPIVRSRETTAVPRVASRGVCR